MHTCEHVLQGQKEGRSRPPGAAPTSVGLHAPSAQLPAAVPTVRPHLRTQGLSRVFAAGPRWLCSGPGCRAGTHGDTGESAPPPPPGPPCTTGGAVADSAVWGKHFGKVLNPLPQAGDWTWLILVTWQPLLPPGVLAKGVPRCGGQVQGVAHPGWASPWGGGDGHVGDAVGRRGRQSSELAPARRSGETRGWTSTSWSSTQEPVPQVSVLPRRQGGSCPLCQRLAAGSRWLLTDAHKAGA